MGFSIVDATGVLLAVAVYAILLVAPGVALARMFGFAQTPAMARPLAGLLVGLATLPAIDSVVTRMAGLDSALGLNLALALAGLLLLARNGVGLSASRLGLGLAVAWLGLLVVEWIDFDVAGKLYQPLTVFDVVKHAATTQAIYDSGAPPRDAFFLRPERASYYYFFYTLSALAMRLCRGVIDARAAVGGLAFWTGIGVYALVRVALDRAGLVPSTRRLALLIVVVLGAGGFDILAALIFAWTRHYWIADPLQWNQQVGAWFEDIVWVPHHVTALIAGTVGIVSLCDAIDDPAAPRGLTGRGGLAGGMAGVAFAAVLGLSVWVAMAFVAVGVAWAVIMVVERRWRAVGLLVFAGTVALVIAAPQIIDLQAGRAGHGALPIAFAVRGFTPVEGLFGDGPLRMPAQIILQPLNYAIEFGPLALGTFFFWRQRGRGIFAGGGEFGRVLVVMAVTCLLIGTFLCSTIFNNDLGWRVLLLPLLAGTVWTIAALDYLLAAPTMGRPLWGAAFAATMGVGWGTVLFAAVTMRAYPFLNVNPGTRFIAADPATARALRVAYDWTARAMPASVVLQQNPTFKRAFAFGLYGRNPIGVADSYGSLYGADPRAVTARIDAVGPIFKSVLSLSDVSARAIANGIDDLVVTADDPVWSQPDSFVWRVTPVYATPRVRIIPVVTVEATR